MKLPRAPISSPYIHPVQMPTECVNNYENIDVIAIGSGQSEIYQMITTKKVFYIHQNTMTNEDCDYGVRYYRRNYPVICTPANKTQTVYHGDSGKSRKLTEILSYFEFYW